MKSGDCGEKRRAGFTLVELSVVLVVLGLISGGVLGGTHLVEAARLRAVASGFADYRSALFAYKQSYNALPGDDSIATSRWTAASNCSPANGTGVCNGNGDGAVDALQEYAQTWLHLSRASMISGTFSGVPGTITSSAPGPVDGSFYDLWMEGTAFFGGAYRRKHVLAFYSRANWYVLTPEQAQRIDAMIDDGKASTGLVYAIGNNGNGYCTDVSEMTAGARYDLTSGNVECVLNLVVSGL